MNFVAAPVKTSRQGHELLLRAAAIELIDDVNNFHQSLAGDGIRVRIADDILFDDNIVSVERCGQRCEQAKVRLPPFPPRADISVDGRER